MARHFIAIDLPADTLAALARIQPRPGAGLRLTSPRQMHLTLHFIGESDVERLGSALAAVHEQALTLEVQGVGRFPPGGKPSVLWAGIAPHPALTKLHAAIGEALRAAGFPTESRPFAPHITLARCTPQASPRAIDHFLQQNDSLSLQPFAVDEFRLYSSTMTANGPNYRCERSFALTRSISDV
jgi:2'-5' RNA ligase